MHTEICDHIRGDFFPVFKNFEVGKFKAWNIFARLIGDGYIQNNEISIDFDYVVIILSEADE